MSTQTAGVININTKFFHTFDFENLNDFKESHQCICELFIHKEGYLKRDESFEWTRTVLNNPDTMHKALMLNKEGKEAIFLVRVKKVLVGKEEYHITTFTDITELEKARELAESSEKAKANFMANMSHELRTPLNGINGFTQLLAKTEINEKQGKYLSMIKTSSRNLVGIVNDILDFSKIESGNMELEYKKSDPFKEIENTVRLFNARTKSKDISYTLDMDPNISSCLMMDTLRLSQILSNLISNAIKFTPEKGKITVSVQSVKKHKGYEELYFAITDTGIGIPKDRQKAIFEAFTQADSSTTREFGGTGLGLSISVSLVQLFGGTLQLESEVNKGSTFFFNIEAKRCDIKKEAKKVLIVEECEMTKIMLEEFLKQHNVVAQFINNQDELTDKLSTETYKMLFINIQDKVLIKDARKLNPELPIIALKESIVEVESQEGEISDYLNKPLELDAFNLLIEKYFS